MEPGNGSYTTGLRRANAKRSLPIIVKGFSRPCDLSGVHLQIAVFLFVRWLSFRAKMELKAGGAGLEKSLETKIAHLEMIQGVIGRMATDSQTLKTLTITVTAAIIAIAQTSSGTTPKLALLGIVPTFLFWYRNGYYLQVERAYRALYDAVRRDEEVDVFSMEWRPFKKSAGNLMYLAFRPTVWLIYGSAIVLLIVVALVSEGESHRGTELNDARVHKQQHQELPCIT